MLEVLTRDLTLKLFSLLVALVLFVFVNGQASSTVAVDFRIEYRLANDIMIVSEAPEAISTVLRGPWNPFRSLHSEDLEPVIIDLTDYGPGAPRISVPSEAIKMPAGMSVLSLQPASIEVKLDRRVEKVVRVEVKAPNRPPIGYEILDMRADPPRVKIVGPAEAIQAVERISTHPVDLQGKEESFDIEVELKEPDPPVSLSGRRRVKVIVDIQEEQLSEPLEMPVRLDNAPRHSRVDPANLRITVRGPRLAVNRIDPRGVVAVVDVAEEIKAGKHSFSKTVQLQPPLPEGVEPVEDLPQVKVTLPR